MRRACAEQVAEHLDCSTTFLDGHCRRLHHGWIHVLAAVVDHLERHSGGILFPACEAGHPDHDVAWALGRRAACEVQSRNAWEYSLYGWNGQDVRFLNGMRRMPDEEVLVLDRVEALAKDRLLQCYGQEYPRILHRCPLAGETFKPSRVDTEVGPDSRPEPGWTSRIKQPNPREVEKAVALILALDQPEEAVLNA
jgi:LmbE family N-acetylglucosaminyl deacetylase